MATAFTPFSLEDDAFVQGGLLQDVDVEILEAQYVPWDYGGKNQNVSQDVLAARLMLQVLAEDGKPRVGSDGQPEAPTDQYWSCGGNFADVVVTEDAHMAGAGPGKSALTRGSNFHYLLQSLRAKGMPKGYLESGNLTLLKGIRFHLIRIPSPERKGLTGGRSNPDREQTIPVCGSIISGPWGKKGAAAPAAKGAPAKAVNGAPAPPAAAPPVATDADTEARAEALVREVLGAQEKQTVAKLSDLKVLVFRQATKDKTIAADKRNAIGKLAENGAWLEDHAIASVASSGEVTLI